MDYAWVARCNGRTMEIGVHRLRLALSAAISVVPGPTRRLLKWLAWVAFTLASAYVVVCAWLVYNLSYELYLRNVIDALATNGRGDQVVSITEMHGPTHPDRTTITLKRAHRWFSTTLIEGESFEYLVDLKWKDDDTLVLQLDFGCNGFHTMPTDRVGPIRIIYRFGDPGAKPERGYETERRHDLLPQPCP